MKTSNKLLIASTIIILAYLTVYDMGLKAEYRAGAFKSPYYHMHALSLNNFDSIVHNAGNIMGLRIQKGPYGVWVYDNIKDNVNITRHNQTLQIDYNGKESRNDGRETLIIVSCPSIVSVTTNTYIAPTGGPEVRTATKKGDATLLEYHARATTRIIGFDEQVMTVQSGKYTEIALDKDILSELNANVGDKQNGQARLTINESNQIKSANFQVAGKSDLKLMNPLIDKVTYNLSDDAVVTLTGKASRSLNK